MIHLGDLASALADGQLGGLDDHTRARALAHLARCATCQADVAAQRWISTWLRADPPPAPSRLIEALSAIPSAAAERQPALAPSRPAVAPSLGPGRRVRMRYIAAAGIAASVVVGLGAVADTGSTGTRTTPSPTPTPSAKTVSVVSSPLVSSPVVSSPVVSSPGAPPPVDDAGVIMPGNGRLALLVGYRRP